MNKQIEILKQESRKQRAIAKAQVIAASRRVRRSPVQESRNIWLVGSGNPKTPNKFYRIIFDEELGLGEFMCDCKAFEFGTTVPCCHILAAATGRQLEMSTGNSIEYIKPEHNRQ